MTHKKLEKKITVYMKIELGNWIKASKARVKTSSWKNTFPSKKKTSSKNDRGEQEKYARLTDRQMNYTDGRK